MKPTIYVIACLSALGLGCAAIPGACLVIDAAKAACAVITVPLADGGTENIQMSRDELIDTARAIKSAKLAQGYPDGGLR